MAKLKVIDGGTEPAPLDLFSYAALPRDAEVSAREAAAVIKARAQDALQAWCDIGGILKEQKKKMPHGLYEPWCRNEFGWDRSTTSEFVAIHDYWSAKVGISQPLLTADLTRSIALEIARKNTPQDIRDQVEALLVDGQKVTVADIRRIEAG